jgi:hypothetical protein
MNAPAPSRTERLEQALAKIALNAQFALSSGASFDLAGCVRLCNQVLQGDNATWPFAPLTGPQVAQRENFEVAMRADQLRGLPTDFGALA